MTSLRTMALAGLGLLSLAGSAQAQRYDYGDDRYERRGDYDDRDDGYRRRGGRDFDRDDDDRFGRGRRRDRSEDVGFDSREYLRCNPDVARAVRNGQMPSAATHFRLFGRREGRRLSC